MDNASGRVQVWARVRPPIEQDHGPCHAVDCIDKTVRVRNDAEAVERMLGQADTSPSPEPKEFAFDGVFGESSAQRDVFMQIGLPVLREALRGINGTILAYGQTGSGKTHSLLHQSSKGEEAGLLPRLVASLFLMISQDVANVYDVEAAAVQVYNEQVDDLLNPDHQSGQGNNLNVRDGGIVTGLNWIRCMKPDEMLESFTRARANVVYAETKMNKASSRSHAIFQLRISKRERVFEAAKTGQKVECTIARLNVVDLAGSERVKKSGSEGMRFQEATNINRSLLAFGNVVSALAARKSHVPLRDSKLTRILDGSIGGNCRTALLVCVNPAFEHVGETLNTLEFASRAMRVEVDAKVNTALVEVSAKNLLADLNPEAHEFGKKVMADKKEIEALRKQSAEAAEQAKKEAERREKAVQEAEGHVKKLQQAVQDAEKTRGEYREQVEALKKEKDAVQSEADKIRKAAEKANADVQEARSALDSKVKEVERLKGSVQKAEREALEWKAAAEQRAQEVKEVLVVQAKKDTSELVKKKEEVTQAKKSTDEAIKKLEDAKKQLAEAGGKVSEAEARASAAEKAAASAKDRASAAEQKLESVKQTARSEAQQDASKLVKTAEQERQKVQAALDVAMAEARELRESLKRESEQAETRTNCLEADLEHRTQELQQKDQLLDEAKAQLQLLKQESEASEKRLREELQEQVDSLRHEQEKEARDLQTQLVEARAKGDEFRQESERIIEEERQRHQGEIATLEVMMTHKAALWNDEKTQLLVDHAATVDAQRQEFENRLSTVKTELEERLADVERAAEEERHMMQQHLADAHEEARATEEKWKEMKEEAVKEAWEGGNAQQRRLAAAFKAAREINHMKESEMKAEHENLSKRFASRESREEDVKQISDQRRRLQEAQMMMVNKDRDLKEIALELQNRDECDRIFGSAERRKPKQAVGMGQAAVGKKLGEAAQFGDRDKRRKQYCTRPETPNTYKGTPVLLGQTH